ncbi:MAG TPA: YfhO family protein, partial [Clostridia bacterium]|nr:YfhO family protein [Clostridia bacterium]
AGTVSFTSYEPKRIVLKAEVEQPAILLLNDRYESNWKVFVDGKPEQLLRCNYIMRGARLTPGTHQVELRFEPPVNTLYVSFAAIGLAVLLLGFLCFSKDATEKPGPEKNDKKSI